MQSESLVVSTTKLSLKVQVFATVIGFVALLPKVDKQHEILKDVLKLETAVQVVELLFYMSFVNSFNLATMGRTRYSDWVITTPLMLLTTIVYLMYVEHIEKNVSTSNPLTFKNVWESENSMIIEVILYNVLMLGVGYLGEVGVIDKMTATVIGFVFFFMTFRIIYEYGNRTEEGRKLFKFLVLVWGAYGIAYLFPIENMNISYNILDIVSKNFFGLYLTYKVYQVSKTKKVNSDQQ